MVEYSRGDTEHFPMEVDVSDKDTLQAHEMGFGWLEIEDGKTLCMVLSSKDPKFLAVGFIRSRAQMESMIERFRENADIVWPLAVTH